MPPLLVDRPDESRQGHVAFVCDRPQPLPECALEAYARLVTREADSAPEDQRFHCVVLAPIPPISLPIVGEFPWRTGHLIFHWSDIEFP